MKELPQMQKQIQTETQTEKQTEKQIEQAQNKQFQIQQESRNYSFRDFCQIIDWKAFINRFMYAMLTFVVYYLLLLLYILFAIGMFECTTMPGYMILWGCGFSVIYMLGFLGICSEFFFLVTGIWMIIIIYLTITI